MTVHREIQAYWGNAASEHHRYHSWEHCYRYFQQIGQEGLAANREQAALQLAFYLASWGMYRGSSFLLQHAYTVHLGVIGLLGEPRFQPLWGRDFGAAPTDSGLVATVLELVDGIRQTYRPFVPLTGSTQPTDTLLTKVVLGTVGCLPSCDRYFIDGFRSAGFKYSCLNCNFVDRVLVFCQSSLPDLQREQSRIETEGSVRYPLMKLTDMYFWQLGLERDTGASSDPARLT